MLLLRVLMNESKGASVVYVQWTRLLISIDNEAANSQPVDDDDSRDMGQG